MMPSSTSTMMTTMSISPSLTGGSQVGTTGLLEPSGHREDPLTPGLTPLSIAQTPIPSITTHNQEKYKLEATLRPTSKPTVISGSRITNTPSLTCWERTRWASNPWLKSISWVEQSTRDSLIPSATTGGTPQSQEPLLSLTSSEAATILITLGYP